MPRKRGAKKSEATKRRWENLGETSDIDKGYCFPSKSKSSNDDEGYRFPPKSKSSYDRKGMPPPKAQKCKTETETENIKKFPNMQVESEQTKPENEKTTAAMYQDNKTVNEDHRCKTKHPRIDSERCEQSSIRSEAYECEVQDSHSDLNDLTNSPNVFRANHVVQGNFHQGDLRFLPNSGKQCVPNSLSSVVFSKIKDIETWDSSDLDYILERGNELYENLRNASSMHTDTDYLLISELPDAIELFGMCFELKTGSSLAGLIGNNTDNVDVDFVVSLEYALDKSLSESEACFVTYAGNTFMVTKKDEKFYIFDSHARNRRALMVPDGTSVLLTVHSINDVYCHCLDLARSMNVGPLEQFEVSSLDVSVRLEHSGEQQNTEFYIAPTHCEQDLEVVSDTGPATYRFCPLTSIAKDSICMQLEIQNCCNENLDHSDNTHRIDMGEPCKTRQIKRDGNCFFRALSFVVCGTEDYHRKVRTAVVKHIKSKHETFKCHIGNDYTCVADYIQRSRMQYVGSWATDVEILAACDLFQTDIYTFSDDKWLRFSSNQMDKNSQLKDTAIYLKHCHQTHYDAVLCVKDSNTHVCLTCVSGFPNPCQQALCLKPSTFGPCEMSSNAPKDTSDEFCDDVINFEYENLSDGKHDTGNVKFLKRKSEAISSTPLRKRRKMGKRQIDKFKREATTKKRALSRDDIIEAVHAKQRKVKYEQYWNNTELREVKKAQSKMKYKKDLEYQKTKREQSVQKYKDDKEHRDKVKVYSIEKYRDDKEHQGKVQTYSTQKYRDDKEHQDKVKTYSTQKYRDDKEHQDKVQIYSIQKYRDDKEHQSRMKDYSAQKYRDDPKHRKTKKVSSSQKYRDDKEHQNKVKAYSSQKYREDEEHQEKVRTYSKQKYRHDRQHQLKLKENNVKRRTNSMTMKKQFADVARVFKKEISSGPEYICCVCHRLLFQKQVIKCNKRTYNDKGPAVKSIADKCISEEYLHKCSKTCSDNCSYLETALSTLWVCYTCHRKMMSGKMPAEAIANNLGLRAIPPQLKRLNALEQHLIALHIPFMKVMALPKGRQHGICGPVICVPSDVPSTTNILPRCEAQDQTIRVKLKRKLSFKGHYEYQFVNVSHLQEALQFLKQNNLWYKDVEFNRDWCNFLDENEENDPVEDDFPDLPEQAEEELAEQTEEQADGRLHGILHDTCLQPIDIGQELLDQHFDDILCLAPAEKNTPVQLLMDDGNEAKPFPVLYPEGIPTLNDERERKISLARYIHCRLMGADNRFAKNIDFIFYSQFKSEIHQVKNGVSIALRKGTGSERTINAQMLTQNEPLKEILKCDEGYKFLKAIRGTPPFWQAAQKDLFAMLRQLGIPTWFCSFSSADMRWCEVLEAIMRQEGDTRKASELDWTEKCEILRSNPVTVARMFDHRFHRFLNDVIMSPAKPIGKIADYFYRVEFQQRGSPHTHCLFWVDNAPKVDVDEDETVAEFVDTYVTCKLPNVEDDSELFEIVSHVQTHSKNHSKSCRKKGTECRFGMPRPASKRTFISRPNTNTDEEDDHDITDTCPAAQSNEMTKQMAEDILKNVREHLTNKDQNYKTIDDLFQDVGISQEIFEQAHAVLSKKSNLVLQRDPQDIWINQYNPDLLRLWDANMDIQYVFDAYSCIVYIVSYISKAEREMGLLLETARREAFPDGKTDDKTKMKKLGSIYLHNREVSAQEAVYRVCNLRLKEGSRKVQFIPTVDPVRLSLPLSALQNKCYESDVDNEEIWMTSFVDRYKARPKGEEFDTMCLASFCSEYRVLSKSEVTETKKKQNTVHELQNGLGFVQKRSRTDPAVVRYARFSRTKTPEKYYQSRLQLFLPYQADSQLKPPGFETYQNFYEAGAVALCGKVQSVKSIIEQNQILFEKEADTLEKAEELLENCGRLEDAWAHLCPETELERLECKTTAKKCTPDVEHQDLPDLLGGNRTENRIEVASSVISRDEALPLLRSLNQTQANIFYKIRQWCLDKVHGKNPQPFHLFVTGGAGTGKSHLIKCIYYEATRILSRTLPNPDDVSVMLTAPTGVAAFNIGAATIHSALSIGTDTRPPYVLLRDEKINTLRSKLGGLQILIIDEISMVDNKLLNYIHGRLWQLKQVGNAPFGNVSILAVGDFYQLPPVMAKPLFVPKSKNPDDDDDGLVDFWNELPFSIVELQEIMRQREDSEFAEALNHVRTKKRSEFLSLKDADLLKACETGEENDVMHIFPKNLQVDEYNLTALHARCTDPVLIDAQDFSRDARSGKLEERVNHHVRVHRTSLMKTITIAPGARVMLTKNIDVSDGLVNGVFGTVTHIEQIVGSFPKLVYVLFDDKKIGLNLRNQSSIRSSLPEGSTPIQPQEDTVNNQGGIRRQFPLKLAWACTVHKVQGLTVDKAVVSLDGVFAPGQGYVALSRVTSASGLTIQGFNEDTLYCDERVADAMSRMPQFIMGHEKDKFPTCLMLHNIQGLLCNVENLRCDERFAEADYICLTETWLTTSSDDRQLEFDNYQLHHQPRSECFDSSQPLFRELSSQTHGGVAVYVKLTKPFERLSLPVHNLEYLAFHLPQVDQVVVVVYRTQSFPADLFIKQMNSLLAHLREFSSRKIVMGDFNQDVLHGTSSIEKCMVENGYRQCVQEPTSEGGTLIDHVYVEGIENVSVSVLPTYYSYHEAVQIEMQLLAA